jgi:excisionase family DNA binding protein
MHTLGTAAKAIGVSKSSVYRAIKSGRLSATRTDAGDYAIDESELFRFRDSHVPVKRTDTPPERPETPETAALQAEITGLKQVAELMRAQLQDVREDRDRWRDQAERLAIAPPAPKPTAVPTIVVQRRAWWPRRSAG